MIRALMHALILALALGAAPAQAQSATDAPAADTGPELASGSTATLRGLDKVSGTAVDIALDLGASVDYGTLRLQLVACRYPAEDPNADAFAFLDITDTHRGERLFYGWMVSSAPALNALDHARYDVWVLACG